jgi:hypothetical protein
MVDTKDERVDMRGVMLAVQSPDRVSGVIRRTLQFTIALLRASLITLFVPLLILSMFKILERSAAPGGTSRLNLVFPSVVGLTAMLGGQTVMTCLISWRQQGFFQRLACATVPLGALVVGAGLTQAVISTMQAVVVIVFGGLAMGLPVDPGSASAATGILILCAVCFIAFGMLVASLSNKAENGGAVFMFTLRPMYFLGGEWFNNTLPPALKAVAMWLPTTGQLGREPTIINNGAAAPSTTRRFVHWPTNGQGSFIDAGKTTNPTMSLSTSPSSNHVVHR